MINHQEGIHQDLRIRKLLIIFSIISIILGITINILSIGWLLVIFFWIFLPIYLFHIVVFILAAPIIEKVKNTSIISSLFFLFYSLIRVDFSDAPEAYSGWSMLLNYLGYKEITLMKYTSNIYLNYSIVIMLIVDSILLRKVIKIKKNKT